MVWPTDNDRKMLEFDAFELPGQQLGSTFASTSLDYVLNMDINAPAACQRLTGLICTIAETANVEIVEQMILSGMNIANVNMTYENLEVNIERIKMIKEAIQNVSIQLGKNCPVGISAKLVGRKISTGKISEAYGDYVELKDGESVKLTSDETYKERCSAYTIFVDFINFADELKKGHIILIDKETIRLKVEVISSNTVTCKIETGGILGSTKDIYVPNVIFHKMPNYGERDKLIIDVLLQHQIDIIIAPFVHNEQNLIELRNMLGQKGRKVAIIAKLQTIAGYQALDEIMKLANAIMLSRQELGSDVTPNKMIILQKNIIARANMANIPICISAQLLNTLRTREIPLRAELMDLGNCVLDGVDAVVLSVETALGKYPVNAVQCVAEACKEAEAIFWTKQAFDSLLDKTPLPCDQSTGTCVAAVLASQRIIAAAIIVVTSSGKTAHLVSKFRPKCPIIAVTRYLTVAKQLHLFRGVMPVVFEDLPNMDWQLDLEHRVNFGSKWGLERGFIRIGDPMVLVCGWRQGSGFTNTLRIVYASADTILF